ncbi:MAG TPA: transposase [Gallionella sp.]|nr:transposase [Gallionella sp.]
MKNATSHVDLHARNLRKGRFSKHGRPYLITSVAHSRRPIFSDWQIGRLLVEELRTTEKSGLVQSLAWVVMPDYLHWLLILQSGDLPALMRRIKGCSAISINRALCSQGQVWQKGFHDHALRKDEDLQTVARYLVANPLRAGLVERIGDYSLWDAVWL